MKKPTMHKAKPPMPAKGGKPGMPAKPGMPGKPFGKKK